MLEQRALREVRVGRVGPVDALDDPGGVVVGRGVDVDLAEGGHVLDEAAGHDALAVRARRDGGREPLLVGGAVGLGLADDARDVRDARGTGVALGARRSRIALGTRRSRVALGARRSRVALGARRPGGARVALRALCARVALGSGRAAGAEHRRRRPRGTGRTRWAGRPGRSRRARRALERLLRGRREVRGGDRAALDVLARDRAVFDLRARDLTGGIRPAAAREHAYKGDSHAHP